MGIAKYAKVIVDNTREYMYKYAYTKRIKYNAHSTNEYNIQLQNKKRLSIFVHYNNDHKISDTDWRYMEDLAQFSDILVVSNSSVSENELKIMTSSGWIYEPRENNGFDFGAWKDVIITREELIKTYDEVFLVNNSCFFPVYPLEMVLRRMETQDLDFWGITAFHDITNYKSREAKILAVTRVPTHIQSYFLCCDIKRLGDVFFDFWKEFIPRNTFTETVKYGEIALTQYFAEQGKKYSVYIDETLQEIDCFDSPDLSKHHPDMLLAMGSPLIKKKSLSLITSKQRMYMLKYLQTENIDLYKEILSAEYEEKLSKTYRYLNCLMKPFVKCEEVL